MYPMQYSLCSSDCINVWDEFVPGLINDQVFIYAVALVQRLFVAVVK